MVEKTVSSRFKIVGRSMKCKGGHSVVEQSAYISRTTMKSGYDGRTYYPKYSEDLVHVEISLPEGAPEAYKDRAVLWNSVEMFEKRKDAQYARTNRFPLPNDWSYETAVTVMRDYIHRNFVSKGMCCEWAVHDSENPKTGQRNLHCHIILTMRPILKDGTWGARQKKIYKYDEQGNKIKKKNGRYDCTTQDIMGWDDRKNAMLWRQDFADTVNAVNEKLRIDEHWDHRSYKERGLDIEPTVHLGPKAAALERKGIHTERGDINREVKKHNAMIASLKRVMVSVENEIARLTESVQAVKQKANEVMQFIRAVLSSGGALQIPVQTGKYVRRISNREALRKPENIETFLSSHDIDTFAGLRDYADASEKALPKTEKKRTKKQERRDALEERMTLYRKYAPYLSILKKSSELKGREKRKYDKEHRAELDAGLNLSKQIGNLLEEGEKVTVKSWAKEAGVLDEDIRKLTDEISVTITGLAFKEVIDHTREYYDRSVEPKSMQARLFRASEKSRKLDAERKAQRDVTQKKRNGQEL